MNLVRALDANGDWIFGIGRSAYITGNKAVAQQIRCNLLSFLGNCFWDVEAGIDWFGLLGAKDQGAITLAVSSTILNTPGVTGIKQVSVDLNRSTRQLTVKYNAQTVYSVLSETFQYDLGGQGA